MRERRENSNLNLDLCRLISEINHFLLLVLLLSVLAVVVSLFVAIAISQVIVWWHFREQWCRRRLSVKRDASNFVWRRRVLRLCVRLRVWRCTVGAAKTISLGDLGICVGSERKLWNLKTWKLIDKNYKILKTFDFSKPTQICGFLSKFSFFLNISKKIS